MMMLMMLMMLMMMLMMILMMVMMLMLMMMVMIGRGSVGFVLHWSVQQHRPTDYAKIFLF